MMGQQPRTDSLFYYFRLEDQIPNDHLLKRLDRFIDFAFVRERLRDTYSAVGRPSIDPEVLLRLLLAGGRTLTGTPTILRVAHSRGFCERVGLVFASSSRTLIRFPISHQTHRLFSH